MDSTPGYDGSCNQSFRILEKDRCPFVNLPETRRSRWGLSLTRQDMENCRWLLPKLVTQIEFTEWTPDGHLRDSSFAGCER